MAKISIFGAWRSDTCLSQTISWQQNSIEFSSLFMEIPELKLL